jgi:hypothetical protein
VTTTGLEAVIAALGVIFSLLTSLVVVAFSYGRLVQRVNALEAGRVELATKSDIGHLSESIAEIRGMFKLTLRDDQEAA